MSSSDGAAPRTVRWGILGTGAIADAFATGLRYVDGAVLQSVGSRRAETAQAFAARHGTTRAVEGYDGVLEDPLLDVVYVATPNRYHREHTLAAIAAGRAVLCEKPFTLDAAEALEVAHAARRAGVFCMEAMWMRCSPVVQRVVDLVRDGSLGDTRLIEASLGFPNVVDERSRLFEREGGGALLDLGVYPVSLVHALWGSPTAVRSSAVQLESGVDEQFTALIEFDGSRQAMVAASLRSRLANAASVHGTEALVHIDDPLTFPRRYRRMAAPPRPAGATSTSSALARLRNHAVGHRLVEVRNAVRSRPTTMRAPGNGYSTEAAEVMRCLAEGRTESPLITLDDSVAVMATLDRDPSRVVSTGSGAVMRFAVVGCGYVADFYLATLASHPELELVGVFDRDPERARRFAEFHHLDRFESLDQLLEDPRVELVANLTNPRSHYSVSRAALEAGKHVYSEKPLSTDLAEATELVELAERLGLILASAPCNLLGGTAQTMWKALRQGRIGTPRLAYAEIDDGPKPIQDRSGWLSDSGIPWPARDEFEMGCTLEHAAYYLSWFTAFFGPATRMTSFATVVMPDKGIELDRTTNDFSVACFEFESGLTARLTCSIYAPDDRQLRIFGDDGVLSTHDCWNYSSPVRLYKRTNLGIRAEAHPRLARLAGLGPRRIPLVAQPRFGFATNGSNPMDFCRGVAEVAEAIRDERPSRLPARWALHVNELVLAMQDPAGFGSARQIESRFEPIEPMTWAR